MTIDTIASSGAVSLPRAPERSSAGATTDAAAQAGTPRAPAAAVDTIDAVKGTAPASALDQAVDKLNKSPQANAQGLEFSIDPDSKRTVVKLVDQKTKEVLRQIPSKEALAIADALDTTSKGLLIQQTA
jgi:flagellar protein FlaG